MINLNQVKLGTDELGDGDSPAYVLLYSIMQGRAVESVAPLFVF